MMAKLVICFCICLVVFLGSIAGFLKGLNFTDSEKPNIAMFGTLIAVASGVLMVASLSGVIAFAIKLFVFYLYGAV